MEDVFYIMEIIVRPFDRGSSDSRLKPAKENAGSSLLSVCFQKDKRMTAETCICLLFEHSANGKHNG